MKTIEEIMLDNDNIYLWEDNVTLDITLPTSVASFKEQLFDCKCPSCDTPATKFHQDKVDMIAEDTRGIQLTCKMCQTKLFIHTKVAS